MISTQVYEKDVITEQIGDYVTQTLLDSKKLHTPEERLEYLRKNVCPHIQSFVAEQITSVRCGQEKGRCELLRGFPYNEYCPLDIALNQIAYNKVMQNRKA